MATNYIKKSGDIGIAVNKMQGYLNIFQNQGFIKNRVLQDGVFGSDTKMAVQQFQRYASLPVDGVIGEKTWDAMINTLRKLRVSPHIPVVSSSYRLVSGQVGIDVYKMQEYLNLYLNKDTSMTKLKVDGSYGIKTKQAVVRYQSYNQLKPDGVIGTNTWDSLMIYDLKS